MKQRLRSTGVVSPIDPDRTFQIALLMEGANAFPRSDPHDDLPKRREPDPADANGRLLFGNSHRLFSIAFASCMGRNPS